ncbi:MAG TPA: DUF3604 domain-containing protein, partial [Anaerolineae bacterium]|nr:DUF3604 domain-containing protein [Anaerolineae bacterium]
MAQRNQASVAPRASRPKIGHHRAGVTHRYRVCRCESNNMQDSHQQPATSNEQPVTRTLSRRQLLRIALGLALSSLAVACGRRSPEPTPTAVNASTATPTPIVLPVVSLTDMPIADPRLGHARLRPTDPVVASSWRTFTITYEAGELGLSRGARIEVRLPVFSTDCVFWWPPQTENPSGRAYLTVSSSYPEAKPVVLLTERKRELNRIVVELRGAALSPGDTIDLIYGDTQYGGKGTHVPEWGAPRPQRFHMLVDPTGAGDYALLQDQPTLQLISGRAVRLMVSASATTRSGEPFRVTVRAVDRLGNLVTGYRGLVHFSSDQSGVTLPKPYRFTEEDRGAHTFTSLRAGPGVITITVEDKENRLRGRSNPVGVDWLPEMNIYFGETHVHTQLHRHDDISDGSDLDYVYWYGRKVVGLDFVAPTNHDIYLTDDEWAITKRKAAEYNDPGRFVSFLAFEWTSSAASTKGRSNWGHRNVIYLSGDEPLFRCVESDTDSPEGLFAALASRQAVVIPHHPTDATHPMSWEQHDPRLERLVEIYQVRGSQERSGPRALNPQGRKPHPLSAQAALVRGYRLGFVASTDNHLAQPCTPYKRGERRQHWDRPGIAAILAPELTREALFEALQARRVYGTTLARLLVDFRMDGHFMGEEYETTVPPTAHIRVVGTAPIARITIVRDNEDVQVFQNGGRQVEVTWI